MEREQAPAQRPYSDYSEFTPDVLETLRQEAVAGGDTNNLELILEEAQLRDKWDDTDPTYAHLSGRCIEDLHTFGVI
jgi:hypothetical protein